MEASSMTQKQAKLILDEKNQIDLPIIEGTEGEKAIDIGKLRSSSGFITFDPGLLNTGSCFSQITFIDGEKGILRYRGYPIEQLAGKKNFLETTLLLSRSELPSSQELKEFIALMDQFQELPKSLEILVDNFPRNGHPMALLGAVVSFLAGLNPQYAKKTITEVKDQEFVLAQLMSYLKLVLGRFYRTTQGLSLEGMKQISNENYAGSFLTSFYQNNNTSILSKEAFEALDILLVLHADHEQNCSTSAVKFVASSETNVYASMAAGISALWGPLHGGANEKVLQQLELIHNDGGDVKKYIAKAKDKESGFKLMGFGHRVYKNFDPRASIIKGACDSILAKLKVQDPLLTIARQLEEAALNDSYFKERNLYPNVDFYSGIIYKALGIPTSFFTPMFVIGRLPGWFAQWQEQTQDEKRKLVRPRQIYTGKNSRSLK